VVVLRVGGARVSGVGCRQGKALSWDRMVYKIALNGKTRGLEDGNILLVMKVGSRFLTSHHLRARFDDEDLVVDTVDNSEKIAYTQYASLQ
jgi:hypothetical protein